MKRMSPSVPSPHLDTNHNPRHIYTHCVRPGIEYGSILWSGLAMADNIRLERCNRSAARLIVGINLSMELPHSLTLARASLQPLFSRRKVTQNLFVRKSNSEKRPAEHGKDRERQTTFRPPGFFRLPAKLYFGVTPDTYKNF